MQKKKRWQFVDSKGRIEKRKRELIMDRVHCRDRTHLVDPHSIKKKK